jgi:SWI/SNF-related matrix-associated actin-dependent regulator 1 of chromatin subfamily A
VRMYLSQDKVALDFPYDANQVAEIKTIPGAKWDKVQKLWIVPLGSLDLAREFAFKHNFTVSEEIVRFTVPARRIQKSVYLKNDWIFIRFPYDKVVLKAVKQIPAVTWDNKEMAWKAPTTSISEAIAWSKHFDVPVEQSVTELEGKINNRLEELREASRSTDAQIEIPNFHGTLLPYQKAGVAYASAAKRTFIADEMGLGKSIEAIATLEYSSQKEEVYPAVVVCPPSLLLNWKAEWNRWLPDKRVEVVANRKKFPDRGSYDVVVVGYSNITHWEKELIGHSSYILDESHYCKTPAAQRTRAAIKMAKSAPKHGIVMCLTGTPVTNRPAEYAPQLDIIGKLKEFGGLWGFYRRYCNAYQDSFGQWNISGHSHLDELNDRLRGSCYIRRTKDQVLAELPPVFHSPIVVQGTDESMKEYKKAENDIIKYITDRAKAIALETGQSPYSAAVIAKIKAESNEHLVRLSVLRRLAAKAKMLIVEEWVKERIENGNKVVIAAHHRDIVDELAKKFGNLRIQGGMDVAEVEAHKKKFQEASLEEAPVIVLSIQAAKTGHTLTAAQDILFVELPWTPADLDQTYSRLHRIGQKGSVTATYMLTAGTIDEEIYKLIEKKRSVVNAAVEGGEFSSEFSATQLVLKLIGLKDVY